MESTTEEDVSNETGSSLTVLNIERIHLDMLDFICSDNLLFKFEWLSTWEMFVNRYPRYELEEHPESLKYKFINIILPNLYLYPITPEQTRYFELLKKYDKLTGGPDGYIYKYIKNEKTSESLKQSLKHNVNLVLDDRKKGALLVNNANWTFLRKLSSTDPTIQSALSFMCASNEERANCVLLPFDEIKERLVEMHNGNNSIAAIQNFEQDAKNEAPFQKELEDILGNLPVTEI